MASRKLQRFEDLIAWERAMDLVVHVYDLSRERKFANDFALCNQIHRSSISVPANIAEGFERGSRADFTDSWESRRDLAARPVRAFTLRSVSGTLMARPRPKPFAKRKTSAASISKLRTTVATQRDTAKQ